MQQSTHFLIFVTACALSGSLIARQLPHRGSQGRLRRRVRIDLHLCGGWLCYRIPAVLPFGRKNETA